ncbi:MAG TPA: thiamine diphosphokinase [Candidatus Deferrimicrobium sp.]|nr:thiamine diphosphokinase [Candidatus Deferrimicrobium sp.]
MKLSHRYTVFTHGVYASRHLDFYRRLCRHRVTVAANGGLRFFVKAGLIPDLIIGDMDSIEKAPKRMFRQSRLVLFPARKDKTDLHLALEHCLAEGGDDIDVVMPTLGEPDHFLGNMMLMHLLGNRKRAVPHMSVRFLSHNLEIVYARNRAVTFLRSRGDIVSVMPLSNYILLSCRGTAYDVTRARIPLGDTRGLRNRIVASKAVFRVTGNGLVIRQASRRT